MSNCTSCGANNSGSLGIRPNLSCPPDLSQLLFRFVERKKVGVVKGNDDLAVMNMSKFFVPLNGYSMTSLNLCSGESIKLSSGSAMDLGKRREIQEFDISSLVTASLVKDKVASVTLGAIVGTGYTTATNVPTTGGTGTGMTVDIIDTGGDVTSITINNGGSGYTVGDVITIVQGGGSSDDETLTVDTLVSTTATLNVMEGTVDHGTLGPFDASDYSTFIASLKSALSANTTINTNIEFNNDDLTSVFDLRGRTNGDAFTYTLTIDDGSNPTEVITPSTTQTALKYPGGALKLLMLSIIFCSDCTDSSLLYVEYAYDSDVIANGEAGATWRKSGPMIFLSGAEDLSETDTNKIETIWIRNTRDCDVELQAILAT